MKKIVIVGGGNLGTLLYCEIKHYNPSCEVIICTSDTSKWDNKIDVTDINGDLIYTVNDIKVTNEVIKDADYYFFTIPKHVIKPFIEKHIEMVEKSAKFIFIPGQGGVEFLYEKAKLKNIEFMGFQRIPYTVRLNRYGHSVCYMSLKKTQMCLATPSDKEKDFLESLIKVPLKKLPNYLAITLVPSNPILHTARLYDLFSDGSHQGRSYDRPILFYREWNDEVSKLLLEMDHEVQKICTALSEFDLSDVIPLGEYYESKTPEELTKKLISINALANIESPMVKRGDKFYADLDSRYFKEDFDFGLILIKAIAELIRVQTPKIDMVLKWYGNLINKKILDEEGKIIIREEMMVPQKFGIVTKEQLVDFYVELLKIK